MTPGLFRLLLATIVVVGHFSRMALGTMAVYVFFVLSGYWICRMWDGKYSRHAKPCATFILSRFWRLLPSFLLVNVLAIGGYWLAGEPIAMSLRSAFSNLALLGYASMPSAHYIDPAWSLDIEVQFYICAPLALAALAPHRRSAWALLAALSAGSLLFLLTQSETIFPVFLPFAAFFAMGIAAAKFDWCPPGKLALASAVLVVGSIVVATALPATRGVILGGSTPDMTVFRFHGAANAALAVLAAPLALSTVWRRASHHDRMAGDLSYIVYLLHWQIALLVGLYWGALPPLSRAPYVLAGFVVVYGGSYVIWRYYDRPINAWRERAIVS